MTRQNRQTHSVRFTRSFRLSLFCLPSGVEERNSGSPPTLQKRPLPQPLPETERGAGTPDGARPDADSCPPSPFRGGVGGGVFSRLGGEPNSPLHEPGESS